MRDSDLRAPTSDRPSSAALGLRIAQLWRYPVKSLLGERLPMLRVVGDGVDGDRMWGIQDRSDGRILTARREPRLLFASSRVAQDGDLPVITLPDGQELKGPGPATDAALSTWLAKPVALVAAAESDAARAEYFADATDDSSRAIEWTMPKGRFVDAFPVLVMTTAGLRGGAAAHSAGTWDVRRFRPNVLIHVDGEGWLEDAWAERLLSVGSAQLVPRRRCIRCTMVNRAQPGLERDVNIYKTLHRTHGGEAGMWTQVVQPGVVSEGDSVQLA
ncbi:MAG TPA: MOSC N-terminal beta barrel domain-containing protein [Burkholderiales bacterium]|nr:MOSC N-terminal beta barrel domain-containing protein [Burkholderiales bacterium]